MATTIPDHWLEVLPSNLTASVTALTEVDSGRAKSCFLTLSNGTQLFAKKISGFELEIEEKLLTCLVKTKQPIDFVFPSIYDSNDKLLLTYKVDCKPVSASILDDSFYKTLAQALSQLHSVKEFKYVLQQDRFKLPNLDSFFAALEQVNCEQSQIETLQKQLSRSLEVLSQSKKYKGLVHGDLVPENIHTQEGKLVLLDWEYATIRDVRWDLASVIEEFAMSESQINIFISEYLTRHQIKDLEFEQGLKHWRFLYLAVCFIWAVEEKQDNASYFSKLNAFFG